MKRYIVILVVIIAFISATTQPKRWHSKHISGTFNSHVGIYMNYLNDNGIKPSEIKVVSRDESNFTSAATLIFYYSAKPMEK